MSSMHHAWCNYVIFYTKPPTERFLWLFIDCGHGCQESVTQTWSFQRNTSSCSVVDMTNIKKCAMKFRDIFGHSFVHKAFSGCIHTRWPWTSRIRSANKKFERNTSSCSIARMLSIAKCVMRLHDSSGYSFVQNAFCGCIHRLGHGCYESVTQTWSFQRNTSSCSIVHMLSIENAQYDLLIFSDKASYRKLSLAVFIDDHHERRESAAQTWSFQVMRAWRLCRRHHHHHSSLHSSSRGHRTPLVFIGKPMIAAVVGPGHATLQPPVRSCRRCSGSHYALNAHRRIFSCSLSHAQASISISRGNLD